jgi:hypothetical protein
LFPGPELIRSNRSTRKKRAAAAPAVWRRVEEAFFLFFFFLSTISPARLTRLKRASSRQDPGEAARAAMHKATAGMPAALLQPSLPPVCLSSQSMRCEAGNERGGTASLDPPAWDAFASFNGPNGDSSETRIQLTSPFWAMDTSISVFHYQSRASYARHAGKRVGNPRRPSSESARLPHPPKSTQRQLDLADGEDS